MAWKWLREDIKEGKDIEVLWDYTNTHGTLVAQLYHKQIAFPLGNVWFRAEGDRISILQSYVHEDLRRCGVRSRIHEEMLEWYSEDFYTYSSTRKSKPWLEKMGFTKDSGGWRLKREETGS